jgi:uncharacterized protein
MKKTPAPSRAAAGRADQAPVAAAAQLVIDSRDFARTARRLEGCTPVAGLERLASLLASSAGELAWQARGERRERADGGHDDFLHLQLDGEVEMTCVRCLAGVPVRLGFDHGFRLVGSESEAAREDAEDFEFDVLASSQQFDLGELIEDEAIMALPPIARHEACQLPAGAAHEAAGAAVEPEERVNPFAALAALKKPPPSH